MRGCDTGEANPREFDRDSVVESDRHRGSDLQTFRDEGPVGFRDHEFQQLVACQDRAQGICVEMIGVVMRGSRDIDERELCRINDQLCHPHMWLVSLTVFSRQRV